MKRIRFTGHAMLQMRERGIGEEDVVGVVRNPSIILPTSKGRKKGMGYRGDRGLIVVYAETNQEIWIITSYWVEHE